MLKKLIKLLFIFGLFYQTPINSKSTSFSDFNSRDLSNYFSGIIAFENQENSKALNFFNASKILTNKHGLYLKRYVFSLVLENKVLQATNVLKNTTNKNNLDFFDAYLLLVIDSLKQNDFVKAEKYLAKLIKFQESDRFNPLIIGILKNFIHTFNKKEILHNKVNFGNISTISQAFQRCYLKKDTARSSFSNLINNPNGDYSRYKFFYANYLIENKKIDEAKDIFKDIEFINTTLLLSQGKSWINNEEFKNFTKIFSCNNHNDIVGEFLFLISNLYSTEDALNKSNFYLNLSYYLNPKFKFNLALIAENYYFNNQYKKLENVIQRFNKDNEFYYWFRIKKETQILIKEKGENYGIEFITSKFNKIEKSNPKILFDMANFFKNLRKYKRAIKYYSQIILTLDENSEIKSELLYRRGSSFERLKNFKKSDEDLLSAMTAKPNDAYVLNYLGYSWLERDYKIDKAMKMLKKAYSIKNDDPYIIDSIGWAYYLINDYIKAEKFLKRAVELMPDDPIVNDHYGDILWKLNRKIQARYIWSMVLEMEDAEDKLLDQIKTKLITGPKNS